LSSLIILKNDTIWFIGDVQKAEKPWIPLRNTISIYNYLYLWILSTTWNF